MLQWLGFVIDLNRGIISVPREKIENIKSIMGARSVRARDLPSVIGKLIAMKPGVGPVCCLMTRSMHAMLNKCCYWGESFSLSYGFGSTIKKSLIPRVFGLAPQQLK